MFKVGLKTHFWLLGLAVLLVFFNWGMETLKWQFLIREIETLSFFKAYGAVMAGVAVSSFTPNRVGEFVGRMMILKDKFDTRVIALTIIGGMSQFFMTLMLGIPGLVFFLMLPQGLNIPNEGWIILATAVLLISYAFLFWNLPFLFNKIKHRFQHYKSIKTISEGVSMIRLSGLRYITLLSFVRYLVFLGQFILILVFFEVYVDWWHYLMIIPAIYLAQSIVPSFALSEIGVRLTVTVTLFSSIIQADIQLMAATTLLWFINLMLPASIGALVLLFVKFKPLS